MERAGSGNRGVLLMPFSAGLRGQGHTFTPVQQQICCLNDSACTKQLEHDFINFFFFYSVVNESHIISSTDQVAAF